MAIYQVKVGAISRGKGQSAVAAAAYRSNMQLYDERLKKIFDYTKKTQRQETQQVYAQMILRNREIAKTLNRQTVWNLAEKAETRSNAEIAKEIVVALPRELNRNTKTELATTFAHWIARQYDVLCDLCIHDNAHNPHFHLMISTRKIEIIDDKIVFTDKQRELKDKNFIGIVREKWATLANEYLPPDKQISHLSNEAQGKAPGRPYLPRGQYEQAQKYAVIHPPQDYLLQKFLDDKELRGSLLAEIDEAETREREKKEREERETREKDLKKRQALERTRQRKAQLDRQQPEKLRPTKTENTKKQELDEAQSPRQIHPQLDEEIQRNAAQSPRQIHPQLDEEIQRNAAQSPPKIREEYELE